MSNVIRSVGSACETLDAIKAQAVNALIELDNKIAALKRIVGIMRGAAQVAATPVLPQLPRLDRLTLNDYNALRVACPQFGLPSAGSEALSKLPGLKQIDKLRDMVENAYSSELNKLERGALGAIGQLENQLGKAVNTALKKIGPIAAALDCVCHVQKSLVTAAEEARAKKVLQEVSGPVKPTLIDDTLRQQFALYKDARVNLQRALAPKLL